MIRLKLKRPLLALAAALLLLVTILLVHIYIVSKPPVADQTTVALARIDIKQPITETDAATIGAWLYKQAGVQHVYCNANTAIVVFSFYPAKVSANALAENFRTSLNYPLATRYVPTQAQLQNGCPVAANSFTYKAVKFFKNIL